MKHGFGRKIGRPRSPSYPAEQVMEEDLEDLEHTQILNRTVVRNSAEPSEAAAAKTAKLPRLDSGAYRIIAEKKEEEFRIGQSRILQKLAANAPLSEILERLVLLIEAQSPGMLCSVLLLSGD